MKDETQLIPFESVNALEIFTDQKTLDDLLAEIEKQATDFNPDPETPAGRKLIASQARKVSSSKVVIEDARKGLVADWLAKKKAVDLLGKRSRDFCDELRDRIRQPLTDWENAEKKRLEAAAAAAEYAADYDEAVARNDLIDRENAVKAAEEKLKREAEERAAEEKRIEDERLEKERLEKQRLEAEEKARKEAAEELERLQRQAEQAEQARKDAAEKAKLEKEEAAEKAEAARLQAIEDEQRKAKEEADRLERERLRRIEDEKREAQARAADQENRRRINNEALDDFKADGIGERTARKAIKLIASGKIRHISIKY